MPAETYEQALLGAGLPPAFAGVLVDCDLGIARGELSEPSGDLQKLIGREVTPLADGVKAGLAAAG